MTCTKHCLFTWIFLLVFQWLPCVAEAPRCSGWLRGLAAVALLRLWNKKLDKLEKSNPRAPPTAYAGSGHHRRQPGLCHSPDRLQVVEVGEQCGSEACCYSCCFESAMLPGCGSRSGCERERVLWGVGSYPCPRWGSRREGSPGRLLHRCHGHCLDHNW